MSVNLFKPACLNLNKYKEDCEDIECRWFSGCDSSNDKPICRACDGSGEGQTDGSICYACKGRGAK